MSFLLGALANTVLWLLIILPPAYAITALIARRPS